MDGQPRSLGTATKIKDTKQENPERAEGGKPQVAQLGKEAGFRGVVRIRRRKAPYLAPPQHNVPRSSSNSSKPLGTPISTSRASPSQAPGTAYRNQSIFPSSSRVITLSTVQPSDRPAARPSIERRAVISPRPSSEKADGSALEKATVAASDGCSCTVEDADPSSRV
ncbi:hypothetical protein BU26DRAFT_546558 [Trematosphaeria pertusa]|uniref:Uncharacterized protein n=1 Tax=Trematosphaeria pertusa TaxID=390896 RepID=A0A6A6IUJ0_9PLEO|nr:uncharacterized protein BU26DRAFT_546558 [Trematosphaeria pertusa]KAF2254225.1 hypothetical protein BU26DRAFT_546558 [Trematosphaeria pertusa]